MSSEVFTSGSLGPFWYKNICQYFFTLPFWFSIINYHYWNTTPLESFRARKSKKNRKTNIQYWRDLTPRTLEESPPIQSLDKVPDEVPSFYPLPVSHSKPESNKRVKGNRILWVIRFHHIKPHNTRLGVVLCSPTTTTSFLHDYS